MMWRLSVCAETEGGEEGGIGTEVGSGSDSELRLEEASGDGVRCWERGLKSASSSSSSSPSSSSSSSSSPSSWSSSSFPSPFLCSSGLGFGRWMDSDSGSDSGECPSGEARGGEDGIVDVEG